MSQRSTRITCGKPRRGPFVEVSMMELRNICFRGRRFIIGWEADTAWVDKRALKRYRRKGRAW